MVAHDGLAAGEIRDAQGNGAVLRVKPKSTPACVWRGSGAQPDRPYLDQKMDGPFAHRNNRNLHILDRQGGTNARSFDLERCREAPIAVRRLRANWVVMVMLLPPLSYNRQSRRPRRYRPIHSHERGFVDSVLWRGNKSRRIFRDHCEGRSRYL